MKPETAAKIKYGSWGIICGAIISMIVGFGWGGWSTAGTTQRMTEKTVVAGQAAICVAQFMKDANYEEKLAEFKKESSYRRSDYIEKGGWDKMPGQTKADYGVANACSDGIEALIAQ